MGTINTGLGGPQGVGENSFINVNGPPLTAGNLDDGSIQVDITGAFPEGINYFGTNYTSIYINTNGLITFNAPVTTYAPTNIATFNQPAIAVFWSDVDIRAGTATGTNNIYWDIDPTSGRVTITWLNVRAYSGNASNRNTFQVVLDHSQNGNFRIDMIYQQVQWALLHKSPECQSSPFPGRTYPLASVTGVPSAVKPFRTATRTWNSAT